MKKEQKTIVCGVCGQTVSGHTNIEVIRKEMDHVRLSHPEEYYDMVIDTPLRQLMTWLLHQINRRPKTA